MKRAPLTKVGAEKLRNELRRLKTEERPRIIQAIAEARAHGDLSENAEYAAAREAQSFAEGRIKDIEAMLSNSEIIDVAALPSIDRVVFGATVELMPEEGGNKVIYQLVGDAEADIKVGLISISSPIARAMVGKSEGDIVEVAAPGGIRSYEIVGIKYV